MKISGKKLARPILENIRKDVGYLSDQGISPQVVIVTLGKEDSWEHYVRQKLRLAKELGIKARVLNLKNPSEDKFLRSIQNLNQDRTVHGIIIQRPIQKNISSKEAVYVVDEKKDIDGFAENGLFDPPIWLSVKNIIEHVAGLEKTSFNKIIMSKKITVIGKGETGGGPLIKNFRRINAQFKIIDSETAPDEKTEILKDTDILISAAGKKEVLKAGDLKPNPLLVIGVGLHRENSILKPDFEEKEISKIAKYYTPTPGGIGPLNLAFLFQNLMKSVRILSP